MIHVNGVSRRFGSLLAVDDVSFELEPGIAFGLLGPNGAGKSTLINMIVGLLEPDEGSVVIGDTSSRSEAARIIGVAPQELSLYPELTGAENLRFFASLYGYTRRSLNDRVEWALDFAGLTDRAGDHVDEYSGGMQRRLNLASALIHEPSIVLLDEPTVGVDPQSRNHLFECIERLREEGLTILYTTHYMEEAQRLCDRVAIMDNGRILDLDSVEGLIGRHGGDSVLRVELHGEVEPSGDLPGVLEGSTLRLETSDPVAAINSLHERRIRFTSMELSHPDLESVFLSLTGRQLRDD
ncbi:MAG: ABC transporter ATP-binding protein [Phycisphaerales bacterium JB043]